MTCKNCNEDIDLDEVVVILVDDKGTIEFGITCCGCGSTYSTWVPQSMWTWNEEE